MSTPPSTVLIAKEIPSSSDDSYEAAAARTSAAENYGSVSTHRIPQTDEELLSGEGDPLSEEEAQRMLLLAEMIMKNPDREPTQAEMMRALLERSAEQKK